MRIALCYSGALRTYHHCVINHATVIGEADAYFCVWDEPNYKDRINDPWHYKIDRVDYDVNESWIYVNTPKEFTLKSVSILSLKDYIIPFNLKKDNHLWYQYHPIIECYKLIPNPNAYDCIVRIRPDITIAAFPVINDLILVNTYHWYNKIMDDRNCNEMIFACPPDLAEPAMDVISSLPEINTYLDERIFYGESVFYQHLKYKELLKYCDRFNFGFNVVR